MKNKSNKTTEAQAARLAVAVTTRNADSATNRARLAKAVLKRARKAYKQARKSAKRAAKSAKQAQEKFAALAKYLKRSKPKTAAKSKAKRSALKTKPAAKKKTVTTQKAARTAASPPPPIKLPDASTPATPQVA